MEKSTTSLKSGGTILLSNFNHGEENQIFSRVTGVIAKNETHGKRVKRFKGSWFKNSWIEIEDARWNAKRRGITSPRNTNKGQLYGSAILMSLRKRIKGKGSCGMRFRNSSKGKLIEKFIILISFNYSSLYKYYHIFIIFSI